MGLKARSTYIHPWITLSVETQAGRREIKFLVDTGFGGELAIPRSYTPWFGTSDYLTGAEFADGDIEQSMTVDCSIDWIGGWRDTEAMYVEGPYPLLGMELLDNCAVTFEAVNGRGEIVVERDE